MKRITSYCSVGLLIAMVAFLTACSVSKEGRTMKKTINGDWTLQTANVEGITSKLKAKIFNESDLDCFIGSNWNFNSNNSLGSYTFTGGATGCTSLSRKIRWSVFEPKDAEREFQFKRLDENLKSIDDNNGFRLSVASLTDNTMQLKSPITFEGKAGYIVYNFVKK